MDWIDTIFLPLSLIAWLFISWDAIDRLCQKRGWKMREGIGMIIWCAVGCLGGVYLMQIFNVF